MIAGQRLNSPFIDGRLHWNYDNADYLKRAVHSTNSSIPSWKKIFGTSNYEYDRSGQVKSIQYYAHHGLLQPFLFNLYAKLVGYGEYTPRSFSLLISMAASACFILILVQFIHSPLILLFGGLLYQLMPLNLAYFDHWKYENIAELMLYLTILTGLYRHSFRYQWPFLLSLLFAFHSDYYIYLPIFLFLAYLLKQEKETMNPRIIWGICSLGILTTFALQFLLGFDFDNIINILVFRLNLGESHFSFWNWCTKTMRFIVMNIGYCYLWLGFILSVFAIKTKHWKKNLLIYLGIIVLLSNLIWIAVFQNHSFIHHYSHWFFGPSIALLITAYLQMAAQQKWFTHSWFLICLLILPLLFLSFIQYRTMIDRFQKARYGHIDDIEYIQSAYKRIRYFNDGKSGPIGWWSSPIPYLYTDPIYNPNHRQIQPIISDIPLNPQSDLIVIINDKRFMDAFIQYCKSEFKIINLQVYRVTPSFTYFSFEYP